MASVSKTKSDDDGDAAENGVHESGDGQQVAEKVMIVRTRKNKNKNKNKNRKLNKKKSPLMKLPAEIRNEIFEYALTDAGESKTNNKVRVLIGKRNAEDPEDEWRVPDAFPREYKPAWKEPGLLQVSKQVRRETLELYYTINMFHIVIGNCDVPQAVGWLNHCVKVCWIESFKRVEVLLQPFVSNRGVALFPIAKFIIEFPILQGLNDDSEKEFWCLFFSFAEDWVEYEEDFEELVLNAVDHKRSWRDCEDFKEFFRDWALPKIMHSRFFFSKNEVREAIEKAMRLENPPPFTH